MCLVKRAAIEIALGLKELNLDIDYFKVQKLAYIAQCVHYGRFEVPLSPEKIRNWDYGGSFIEIRQLLSKYTRSQDMDKILFFENVSISQLEKIQSETRDLLYFEEETINFVLYKYGNKSTSELINLVKSDSLYKNISINDIVKLEKLNNHFITKKENEEIDNINREIRKKRRGKIKVLK